MHGWSVCPLNMTLNKLKTRNMMFKTCHTNLLCSSDCVSCCSFLCWPFFPLWTCLRDVFLTGSSWCFFWPAATYLLFRRFSFRSYIFVYMSLFLHRFSSLLLWNVLNHVSLYVFSIYRPSLRCFTLHSRGLQFTVRGRHRPPHPHTP